MLGAGGWGTALALAAARAGHETVLWGRDASLIDTMRRKRINQAYLPEVPVPKSIEVTSDIAQVGDASMLLAVVPAQAARSALAPLAAYRGTLISCAKGIERQSGLRMSEVARAVMPGASIGVLSGPTFAAEVARSQPTALVCAMPEIGEATEVTRELSSRFFRLYPSTDLLGVEIGGALKNVVAIAAGAVMGRELGENARAAVTTRGLAELTRLALALGARPETMAGLSGLGDLMLTATSMTSRNTQFGYRLGRGAAIASLRGAGAKLSEGAWTAEAALALAGRHGLDLPITRAVAGRAGGAEHAR